MHDAHDALRGQKTPPPGVRPGSLCGPGAAEERPHRAALLRGKFLSLLCRCSLVAMALTAQRSPSSSDVPLRTGRERRRRRRRRMRGRRGGAAEGGPGAREEGPVVGAAPRRHEGDGGATLQGILFVQAEEEERGGRGGRLVPPLFLAVLVVDNDSGSLAMLVLLVTMSLALCSLLASPSPGCFASWQVWSRRTAAAVWQGWYCWVTVYLVLCFLPCLQARDAWHHGQYGPGGFFRHVQGLVCWYLSMSPRAVLLLVVSGPRCPSSWLAWTTGQFGASQVQFLDKVFYMPVVCHVWCHGPDSAVHCLAVPEVQFITRRSTLPFDAQWQFPMVQTSADHRDSPVRIWWSMSLFAGFPQVQSWIDG